MSPQQGANATAAPASERPPRIARPTTSCSRGRRGQTRSNASVEPRLWPRWRGLGVLLLTGAFASSRTAPTRRKQRSPRSPALNRSLTSSHQRPPRAYEPAAATWPRTPCARTRHAHATTPPNTSSTTIPLGRARPSRWPSQRRRRPGPPPRATSPRRAAAPHRPPATTRPPAALDRPASRPPPPPQPAARALP